ncbi:VWA domain-containing protein [Cupriavidus alkaliphilus]|uniref:VWA domain-containing protein n=1 Tax=Cupriavidus alkaliphilus TaxID=942866 RepID=UPI0008163235|nr:VWA domain-containing protein [Cupriavidus alkaliphilus]SCB32277.1 Ca-activated chloride channel family protein [Cupriavidus alkaliphilus]
MPAWLDTLAHFHFLRPWWLLGLLPAALLVWAVRRRGDVRRRWRDTIAPHLLDALMLGERRRLALRPVHLTALLLALGTVALAGPSWRQERPPFLDDKAPLAIAVDLSHSMDAIDVTPTRLERAKLKIKALLARRDGGRTAIYAYAGSTHLVLPLTDDASLLQTFAEALQTRIMPVPGRDMAQALRVIDADLKHEPVPGTILFLTDGVDPAAATAFRAQADSGRSQPVVLALGTEQGGPLRNGAGGLVEQDGARVFARLDVAALERFGDDSGVPVATFTPDSDDDVAWVQRHVQSHLEQVQAGDRTRWKDEGWWLVPPLALLAMLWFRKGWTVRWSAGLLLALALAAPPEARAQSSAPAPQASAVRPWRFVDLWLTHDQQGRRAFEQGDFARAATLFDDPMWRGIAQYRAGQYAQAVQSFARVDSAQADYNQGNALARQGQYRQAAARYRQALRRQPQWPAASANLALMEKLLAQQLPQEKPDPDDGEEPPDLPPDQVKYDAAKPSAPGGKSLQVVLTQDAEMWMRAIQTTPTDLLQRKFALQHGQAAPAQDAR